MHVQISAVVAMLIVTSAAGAVDLLPADYSPVDGASIRTLRLEDVGAGETAVVVAIANSTDEPFNANYSCTSFDRAGNPSDEASSAATAVPPRQEVVSTAYSLKGNPDKVVCRIEFTIPTKR